MCQLLQVLELKYSRSRLPAIAFDFIEFEAFIPVTLTIRLTLTRLELLLRHVPDSFRVDGVVDSAFDWHAVIAIWEHEAVIAEHCGYRSITYGGSGDVEVTGLYPLGTKQGWKTSHLLSLNERRTNDMRTVNCIWLIPSWLNYKVELSVK